jgi:D-amino-acid dehydrogenase
VSDQVIGGFHAQDDWHVQPQSVCGGLERHLRAAGVGLRPDAPVVRVEPDGSGWRTVLAGGEVIASDAVVVAAGAYTGKVVRSAGVRLLMEPAKGYSLTGQARHKPSRALYMIEAKLGCSPYADTTRIAGTLELGGFDESLNPRRMESLDRAAARYLEGWTMTGAEKWAGFRPATPDGLPYIGETDRPGLYVAAGHGMLGVTLGAGTGMAIGQAIGGGKLSVLEPFRPGRPDS